MSVTIRIPAALKAYAGDGKEVEVAAHRCAEPALARALEAVLQSA